MLSSHIFIFLLSASSLATPIFFSASDLVKLCGAVYSSNNDISKLPGVCNANVQNCKQFDFITPNSCQQCADGYKKINRDNKDMCIHISDSGSVLTFYLNDDSNTDLQCAILSNSPKGTIQINRDDIFTFKACKDLNNERAIFSIGKNNEINGPSGRLNAWGEANGGEVAIQSNNNSPSGTGYSRPCSFASLNGGSINCDFGMPGSNAIPVGVDGDQIFWANAKAITSFQLIGTN